jgi:hypothetical protein
MHALEQYRGLARTAISRVMVLVCVATIFIPGWPAAGETGTEPSSSAQEPNTPDSHTHMAEEIRASVNRIVVVPGLSPPEGEIKGTYDEDTPGLLGGMQSGSRAGNIPMEVGGVAVNIPIPILTIPGAIFGGLSGAAKRRIQEFRDRLTDELVKAERQQLTNEGLALDVYSGVRKLPNFETKLFAPTTPIPEDTDAILYVGFKSLEIDVQEDDAIITTSAIVTLRRLSDRTDLYEKEVKYQDRDTLENWTLNDTALWHDYANFARHYFGRELSAEAFSRVELRHELRPKKSDTVSLVKKNEWQGVSKSTSPTLAWELTLLGNDSYGSWADEIDESDIYYDVEIYDVHRPVYEKKQIQASNHTIEYEIDACKTYRWSVRPTYHVDGAIKYGEWMKIIPEPDTDTETETELEFENGIAGRRASSAPAYIQDFASLEIKCGKKKRR